MRPRDHSVFHALAIRRKLKCMGAVKPKYDLRRHQQTRDAEIREKLTAEIAAFIDEFAGTSLDYDPVLEAAALEAIAHEEDND
jgi:hypothetical protein